MFYAMSGTNGDYELYKAALRALRFRDVDDIEEKDIMDEEAIVSTIEGEDVLYVLGNMIGSGDGSMKILLDMMRRDNVIAIVGENEYRVAHTLKALDEHIRSTGETPPKAVLDKITSMLDAELIHPVLEFIGLSDDDREDVMDYIEEITEEPFLEVYMARKKFLLVHAGIRGFRADREPDDYSAEDYVTESADIDRTYYKDKTLVIGRRPDGEEGDTIIHRGSNVVTDCGRRGGIYCLNNGRDIYAI